MIRLPHNIEIRRIVKDLDVLPNSTTPHTFGRSEDQHSKMIAASNLRSNIEIHCSVEDLDRNVQAVLSCEVEHCCAGIVHLKYELILKLKKILLFDVCANAITTYRGRTLAITGTGTVNV